MMQFMDSVNLLKCVEYNIKVFCFWFSVHDLQHPKRRSEHLLPVCLQRHDGYEGTQQEKQKDSCERHQTAAEGTRERRIHGELTVVIKLYLYCHLLTADLHFCFSSALNVSCQRNIDSTTKLRLLTTKFEFWFLSLMQTKCL